MNFARICEDLNFLQSLDNATLATLETKLNAYESVFRSYQKVHNISKFGALEDEIIDSLKILDFAEFWANLGLNLSKFGQNGVNLSLNSSEFQQNGVNLSLNSSEFQRKLADFKIIDVGSGAGFPAIFLALILKADFALFEPNAKKAAFLMLIKNELKLPNLSVFKSKIEDFKGFKSEKSEDFKDKKCEKFKTENLALKSEKNENFKCENLALKSENLSFKNENFKCENSTFKGEKNKNFKCENLAFKADLITSRALMKIPNLIALCKNFADKNTTFLFYKGSEVFSELKSIKNYEILSFKKRNFVLLKGV